MRIALSNPTKKLVGELAGIQAIQVSNLLPLLLDPEREFLLGLVVNFAVGAIAISVAYCIWTRKKGGPLIALLFAMIAFASATYLQYLATELSMEAGLPPPLTISLIAMAVNVTIIALLLLFVREVLKPCRNKPLILVDRGPWYRWAFIQLGLKSRHMTFRLRNRIEQWFSHLKARTKRFYNDFPHGSSLKSVQTYLAIHTATYNLLLGLT